MIDLSQDPEEPRRGLATVSPMRHPSDDADQGHDDHDVDQVDLASPIAEDDQDRAVQVLRRRYADRWTELPDSLGRRAARAESLLASGPIAIDPATAAPALVIARARLVESAAATTAEVAREEMEVLSEALGTDLADLPMGQLLRVATAVIELGAAPPAEPGWAAPVAAQAAEAVLQVQGGEIQAAARSHEALYERFTEGIWDVPDRLLLAGRTRWRPFSRLKLRRALKRCSRTGRLTAPLSQAIDLVAATRAARTRLAQAANLLSNHLGSLDRGPLTDVDAALEALLQVRRLQRALVTKLDPARLGDLLRADAFRTDDVVGPAMKLRATLQSWSTDLANVHGGDPWSLRCDELAHWAAGCDEYLPAIIEGAAAVIELGTPAATLSSLVDDLLARERITDLRGGLARSTTNTSNGSPS